MKRLGIIQPGRIGDIIICLPIARWYADRGYEVIWPVADYVYKNFSGYVDYVNFIPTPGLDCAHAHKILLGRCNHILDLSITFPNGNSFNDSIYLSPDNKISFDRLKYIFADVPIEEKFKLKFNRNITREADLYDMMLGGNDDPYTLAHLQASSAIARWEPAANERVLYVSERTGSVLDWCKIIENASKIVMIDSCFANLAEQLPLDSRIKKKLIIKDPNLVNHYSSSWIT